MKFQRRLLPSSSSNYLEMEEYHSPPITATTTVPSTSANSVQKHSRVDSNSDLSEIDSVCSLSTNPRPRSDSLNNLFHLSEDNNSVSNLSLASYSLSQHSTDNNNSPRPFTSLSSQNSFFSNNNDKTSRTRRSVTSLNSASQRSFSIKTTETVLTNIGIHSTTTSDKCGLIAHDGNSLEQNDDVSPDYFNSKHCEYDDPSDDDNDLDLISSNSNRSLRRTVFSNVDRLLNSTNKPIKL